MQKKHIYVIAFVLIVTILSAALYFSLNKPPTSPSSNQQSQFVGSKNSDVYHYPSCTYAQKIKTENKIWFSSSADARAHGYRPCKVCNPP